MAKVNVGTRTKAEDAAALDRLVAEETASGDKRVIDRDGQKFVQEKNAAGLVIETRIA